MPHSPQAEPKAGGRPHRGRRAGGSQWLLLEECLPTDFFALCLVSSADGADQRRGSLRLPAAARRSGGQRGVAHRRVGPADEGESCPSRDCADPLSEARALTDGSAPWSASSATGPPHGQAGRSRQARARPRGRRPRARALRRDFHRRRQPAGAPAGRPQPVSEEPVSNVTSPRGTLRSSRRSRELGGQRPRPLAVQTHQQSSAGADDSNSGVPATPDGGCLCYVLRSGFSSSQVPPRAGGGRRAESQVVLLSGLGGAAVPPPAVSHPTSSLRYRRAS